MKIEEQDEGQEHSSPNEISDEEIDQRISVIRAAMKTRDLTEIEKHDLEYLSLGLNPDGINVPTTSVDKKMQNYARLYAESKGIPMGPMPPFDEWLASRKAKAENGG